jgi:hypothetical protein
MDEPCPGCGAFFPAADGLTHRYIGASAGCWRLFGVMTAGFEPDSEILAGSRVAPGDHPPTALSSPPLLDPLLGDAYAVQHHGGTSAQAIQSVAVHLLVLHASVARGVAPTNRLWVLGRALRRRGVFHKLKPPPVGLAVTIRHLFPGGGVQAPRSRHDYVLSVYTAWCALHRATLESWYERFVVPDVVAP